MWIRRLFLYIPLLFLTLNVFSQAYTPPLRLEIEVPSMDFSFQVIPLGKNGVALLYETDITENKRKKWSIVLFDTNLQKTATTDIWLERNLGVKVINTDKESFYICFQKFDRRTTMYNTYIVQYFIADKKAKVYAINVRDKETVFDLHILDNTVFYATNFNHNVEVFALNLKTLNSVPLFKEGAKDIAMFHFFYRDTNSRSLWTAVTLYSKKTSPVLNLLQLHGDGTVLQNITIPFADDYFLNSCQMTIVDKNKLLLIGAYVNKNELTAKTNNIINSGIFSAIVSNGEIKKSNYFNFVLLSNQLKKGKIASDEKKNVSLNLQLIMDNIVHNDSMYVAIGEVFYPEYRQEYAANYGMYGYTSAPTTVFAGYRYQIAYVLTFDKNADLIWNTQFQYNDVLVSNLKNILHAYIDDNNDVVLFYGIRGEVISTVLNHADIVQATESIPIEMLSPADRIITHYSSTFRNWYANNFIYYGYQTISGKKTNKKYAKKRQVLFINKLAYR
ncbi:MAG TPA: hypothetical protein PLF32_05715 [Bacteroidales bacterium]|nr:hypothetical protein [Bacteroidales bacterium]HON20404.1 hypothetical protein [Bacteroidales bacterium]HOR82132.1 hypothetical protein [Bacteroidales bacterium]HPJ90405.1 hypothetical protein [Bacteroidales bacterium]